MLLFHHVGTVLYLIKNKCGKVKQAAMKERDYHGTGGRDSNAVRRPGK